jgi:hypothetical protein
MSSGCSIKSYLICYQNGLSPEDVLMQQRSLQVSEGVHVVLCTVLFQVNSG